MELSESAACPECGEPGTSFPGDCSAATLASVGRAPDPNAGVAPAGNTDAVTLGIGEEALAEPCGDFPSIAGYELLGELGRGGKGVVYKARQASLNRLVALKMVLSGAHASSMDLVRFLAEAETVAQLDHPHIVQIHEIGKHAGLPYLSLEFVEGGPLSRKLNGTPQPPRPAARFIEVLARGVHFAHGHGIVHRDLKPSNILLHRITDDPRSVAAENHETHAAATADHWLLTTAPKINDFGLAKRIEGGSGVTVTGAILGTPSYMAPEQAGGEKVVGPAADIYALGAILYEMLTGRPPFHAATPLDTVMQVVNDEPVPPRQLQSKVPRDLETICLKCLQKDPRKRYATAEAVADDLARYVNDRPILARPVGRVERSWRWCRRNPSVASLVGLIAVGILIAAALLYQQRSRTLLNLTRAEGAEKRLTAQLQLTEAAEREKTEQLRQSYLDQARAGRFSRKMGQRFDSLAALKKAAAIKPDPQQRDEVIACLALADMRPGPPQAIWRDGAKHLVFDGSYRRYALADDKHNITIRAWDGHREIRDFPSVGLALHGVALSPDGACLGVMRHTNANAGIVLHVYSVETGQEIGKLQRLAAGLAFAPDSQSVAVQSVDGIVHVLDLKTGAEKYRWQAGEAGHALAFSPDGRRLALAYYQEQRVAARVLATATGQLLADLHGNPATCLAWHPGGERLALGSGDGRAFIFDLASRKVVATLVGHAQYVSQIAFHPSGEVLATLSWDGNVRLWNAASGRPLLTTAWPAGSIQFSTDGTILGSYPRGGDVHLMEFVPGLEYRSLVSRLGAGKGYYGHVAIHPDGNIVAAGMDDGVRFWDLETSRELAHLPAPRANSFFFQPDGNAFITCGYGNLFRWPFHADADLPRTRHIGVPRSIPAPGTPQTTSSPDGHKLAVASEETGVASVVDLERPNAPPTLFAHPRLNGASLSVDGRWLVTAGWHTDVIKVWNAQTGEPFKDLPSEAGTLHAFSPDGKTFISCRRDEFCFYDVASWEPIRHLRRPQPGYASPVAFTAGGRIVALDMAAGIIHLVEVASGRTLAKLEDPNHDRAVSLGFSPDGTRLAVSAGLAQMVHVWDLRAIRAQLLPLGLDWDQDAFPPAPQRPDAAPLAIDYVGPALVEPTGPVVAWTPPSKRLKATPEEIAGWVRQLDAKAAKDAQAAEQALLAVGAPALPAVTALEQTGAAPLKKLAAALRQRIEVQEALLPRLVGLKLKDVSVADAVNALAKQADILLEFRRRGFGADEKTITLDLDGVPVWEAVDRLCQAAGLTPTFTFNNNQGWLLFEGVPPPPETSAYAGSLRLQAANLTYRRVLMVGAMGGKDPLEDLSIQFSLWAPPATPIASVGRPRITRAIDAAGKPHLQTLPTAPGGPFYNRLTQSATFLFLSVPTSVERDIRLKDLHVAVPIEIMARRTNLAAVDLSPNQAMTGWTKDGMRIMVQPMNAGFGQTTFHVRVSAQIEFDPMKHEFELIDAKGRRLRAFNSFFTKQPRQPLHPEDYASFLSLPASGSAFERMWCAAVLTRLPRWDWTGQLQFPTASDGAQPNRLVLFSFERMRTELSFEFHDLRLP